DPYVRGNIENAGYYFSEDVDLRRRDYDLDLLLLTQGWSKYSWDNIFRKTPSEKFPHEHGFTIFGNITNKNLKSDSDLFIGSPTEELSVVVDVNENNTFRAENLKLKDSALVTFRVVNQKGRRSKPVVSAKILPSRDIGSIKPPKNLQFKIKDNDQENTDITIPDNFISGIEELGTVYLEGERLTEEDENRELERELNGADMYGRTEVFTKEEARDYTTILSFLRTRGFTARGTTIYSRRELMRKPAGTNLGLPALPAVIIIDGMESSGADLSVIRPTDVEWIYVNKSGVGPRAYRTGKESGGGIIEIKTKTSYVPFSKEEMNIRLTNGFAESKEFYAPRYNSYNNEIFKNYGVVDWFPTLTLENQSAAIQIFDTRQPVKLFLEGMTSDGALISEEILIESK
ncbi:MAG: hypothetical protein R3218_05860, partial [Christiangramia sp.]|nr:hypothetical protein [Christiangramia sp.]